MEKSKFNIELSLKSEEIPLPDWLQPQLAGRNAQLLSQGRKTDYLVIVTPDNQRVTGKLQVTKINNQASLKLYQKKQGKLHIAEYFNSQRITKSDKRKLYNGKFIQLPSGTYLAIDRELNRVMPYNERELQIPNSIGSYKLSKEDKLGLINGLNVEAIVQSEKNNQYYLLYFRQDPNHVIEIDQKASRKIYPNEYTKFNIDPAKSNQLFKTHNYREAITSFLKGNDKAYKEIIELTKKGLTPKFEDLDELINEFSNKRSKALLSAFNLDSAKYEKFREIILTKEVHDSISEKRYKVLEYNLLNNSITIEGSDSKKIETSLDSGYKSKSEFELHIKSMGKARALTPTPRINK